MSDGEFRKAGESLRQEDPGDLEERFLKKQQGGTRLSLWHMVSALSESLSQVSPIPMLSDQHGI